MADRHILIVEDDALIGLDLESIALHAGANRVTLCRSLQEAREQVEGPFDFALLDVDLGDGKSFEIARRLRARTISFAFVSASKPMEIPSDLFGEALVPKPYDDRVIASLLEDALSRRA